jgi:DNA repair exonuclease SbcCD ATPase subunit
LMDSIWTQIYPYDDYYSIRLNVEEDYLVEVLDSDNNWISAEAEVSGGERHSAALVMRLALSFTLSPKIQLLMLDEPTHNMDSSAVEELAETLRQNSDNLVKQMFIVTHDPALESAATGKLYRLEKKNTETGLTEVEEIN